jgi:hypothetical protein
VCEVGEQGTEFLGGVEQVIGGEHELRGASAGADLGPGLSRRPARRQPRHR